MSSELHRRPSHGYVNAVARDNQLLPGDWRQLASADFARIALALARHSSKHASLATLEASMIVRALITTGRPFAFLSTVMFRAVERGAAVAALQPALLYRERHWSWWLPAGGPNLRRSPDRTGMLPTSENIWLPLSSGCSILLKRCLIARGVQPSAEALPLFVTPVETLRARALAILQARPQGAPKARRSASTIESAQRWLLRAIAQEPGGEIGAASLITGREQTLAKPMTHYGALTIPRAIKLHAAATRRIDRQQHNNYPPELAALNIGDPSTPSDETVRIMVKRLATDLACGTQDESARHGAMMRYTCALLAYALALRGRGALPGEASVDRRTGFCLVHDKYRQDPHQARLLWVPQIARDQLLRYYHHLDRLEGWLGIAARAQLSKLRNEPDAGAPLFWVRDRYRLEIADLKTVLLSAKCLGWHGEENGGRHWLRSKLSGRCSAETLAAFFGHWQHGAEPWGPTSSLDPLSYRADLERCLDPILSEIGWRAIEPAVPARS